MGLGLILFEQAWSDGEPQVLGEPIALGLLASWVRTLGAAEALRSVPRGDPFADWLDAIVASGVREHLVSLDPWQVGELEATWRGELLPRLEPLTEAFTTLDFACCFGVRSAGELRRVLEAWAAVVSHAMVRGHGLSGRRA